MSAAGKRAGIKDGTRSGLWSVFAEAIDVLRPRYVVIENVRGLLSAAAHRMEPDEATVGNGTSGPVLRAAGAVLGDLADLGYDAQWATVAAADVGAPHRRERVFILATAADADDVRLQADQFSIRRQPSLAGPRASVLPLLGDAAHTSGDGWDEGRAESARLVGGSDAALRSDGHVDVPLLPTPVVTDAMGARNSTAWRSNPDHNISIGDMLTDVMWKMAAERGEMQLPTGPTRAPGNGPVDLLPTPRSSDCFGAGLHGDGGMDLRTTVTLLPTPNAVDGHPTSAGRHSTAKHPTLNGEVRLLPTPRSRHGDSGESGLHRNSPGVEAVTYHFPDAQWGKYEPAIRRWENLTRPAPAPTEPNKNGNPRLSAAFSEWLMGWPAGWVTDPAIGISRNDQLRIVGNGVCVQQAVAALRYLLSVSEVAA